MFEYICNVTKERFNPATFWHGKTFILPSENSSQLLSGLNSVRSQPEQKRQTKKSITTMLRGFTKFRCPDCGHIFEAPDIEDSASVRTAPMPCPCCGTKSYPVGLIDRFSMFRNRKKL